MAHWNQRKEPSWKDFEFNIPYEKGLKRLREEVIAKTDFDPSVLWVSETMQAMAVIKILEACEQEFGARGQEVVIEAIRKVGLDVGRQIIEGLERPAGLSDAEAGSFLGSVINRIPYASLEDPSIDSDSQVSFHILWCPHQDCYEAFECRVQRYFVQGMLDSVRERGYLGDWQIRVDQTIPAGAKTCHFVLWRASDEEKPKWESYSQELEKKALEIAERRKKEEGK